MAGCGAGPETTLGEGKEAVIAEAVTAWATS